MAFPVHSGGSPATWEPAPSSLEMGLPHHGDGGLSPAASLSKLDGASPDYSAPASWVPIPTVSRRGPCGQRELLFPLANESWAWDSAQHGEWFLRSSACRDPLRSSLASCRGLPPFFDAAEAGPALPRDRLSLAVPLPLWPWALTRRRPARLCLMLRWFNHAPFAARAPAPLWCPAGPLLLSAL